MSVNDGIIMAADMQSMNGDRIVSKTIKKLFSIGDNIGVNMGGMALSSSNLYLEHLSGTKNYDSPIEAARDIMFFFIEDMEKAVREKKDGMSSDTEFYVAGYDKTKAGKKTLLNPIGKWSLIDPEIYHISVQNERITSMGCFGFLFRGANSYFNYYCEKINEKIFGYTLQDAVNITKLAFDTSRSLGKYLDGEEYISEDIEMLAITPLGIEWVQKKELEMIYVKRSYENGVTGKHIQYS
jgi:hypothetical protein